MVIYYGNIMGISWDIEPTIKRGYPPGIKRGWKISVTQWTFIAETIIDTWRVFLLPRLKTLEGTRGDDLQGSILQARNPLCPHPNLLVVWRKPSFYRPFNIFHPESDGNRIILWYKFPHYPTLWWDYHPLSHYPTRNGLPIFQMVIFHGYVSHITRWSLPSKTRSMAPKPVLPRVASPRSAWPTACRVSVVLPLRWSASRDETNWSDDR